MPNFNNRKQLISLVLALVCLSSPLMAQTRRGATPRRPPASTPSPAPRPAPKPAATFDTLLAADSYRFYAEVRGVGQLIQSPGVTDLLEPIIKLGSPPEEFTKILNWLNSQADALAASRMLVAGWPERPKLPTVLIAVEFPSAEEAQKFHPKLRGFIPKLLPTPTPTPSPAPPVPGGEPVAVAPALSSDSQPGPPAPPPYHLQQTGSLVLLSDKEFQIKDLTPRGSKLLSEDPNFATARNRFAPESIFVYVDVKAIEKEQEEQKKTYEEEEKERQIEAAKRPPPEEPLIDHEAEMALLAAQVPSPMPEGTPPVLEARPIPDSTTTVMIDDGPRGPVSGNILMYSLTSLLFGGESAWPEAVAGAIAFEGDAYVLRALIMNAPANKALAIPFLPQMVSGPAIIPESPSVFPADTDLFVALSLDYPQVYEGMVKAAAAADEMARKYGGRPASMAPAASPFAPYEEKLGIKIKDDLLPLLGNEFAVAFPKPPAPAAESSAPPKEDGDKKDGPPPKSSDPNPVFAISVKDRDALKRLIPKMIESMGFKGANLLAQSEKRQDTEIISYAGAFSYAFVGNFLLISPDSAATRGAVDSFLDNKTLSSDSHFRNSIRWQPRQLLGQVYVAPDMVERYYPLTLSGSPGNDRMREYLSRLNPALDPVSYSLTNDGLGPLHELHVPKNILMMLVAGLSKETSDSPLTSNESITKIALQNLVSAQSVFKSTQDDGRYGTLDELVTAGLIEERMVGRYGYKVDVVVSGASFSVTAVPHEYGKTGLLSYFIDESGVLRGGDHGGGSATVADPPIQ